MPASEIDEIFSAKTKQVVSTPLPSSSEIKEKKKKKKTKKLDAISAPDATARSVPVVNGQLTKKRPAPEIIVDPSASLPSAKRVKVGRSVPSEGRKSKAGNSVADKEDEVRFKDSRGSGPRRKTEEGFAIYKEDELGIGSEGGDTPLCPFDCQCCF